MFVYLLIFKAENTKANPDLSFMTRFRRNIVTGESANNVEEPTSTLATVFKKDDTLKDLNNLLKGFSGDLETLDDHKNVEEDLLPEKFGLPAIPYGGHRDHHTRDEVYKHYNNHEAKMRFGDVGVRQIFDRQCCRFDCDRVGALPRCVQK